MCQSAPAISAIHLISLAASTPVPSAVKERGVVVVGGGGGGCSDRDTLLNVLCVAPVKTPNQMKTNGPDAQKASCTMRLVWDFVFFFNCRFVCFHVSLN